MMMTMITMTMTCYGGHVDVTMLAGKMMMTLITMTMLTGKMQTWNLSKNLHRRIFRLKILHIQFHLISTVLVGKNTKNE